MGRQARKLQRAQGNIPTTRTRAAYETRINELAENLTILLRMLAAYPRAASLMRAGKPFIAVPTDEPYSKSIMDCIREHRLAAGTWSDEDEHWAQQHVYQASNPPAPPENGDVSEPVD